MSEDLINQQGLAIKEHAEAFAQYLIIGRNHKENQMGLYYDIVAPYWRKCNILQCDCIDSHDVFRLLFINLLQAYMKKFKDSGIL